jgi:N-acetylmuramic acid 6-phosphate etherase
MAGVTDAEAELYDAGGVVTYFAEDFGLDILTDTTERSPTFSLPPFRPAGDDISPRSWAFLKNPLLNTDQAWKDLLARPIEGLDWDAETYREMEAPGDVAANPPRLNRAAIEAFQVGNEPAPARWSPGPSMATAVVVTTDAADDDLPTRQFIQAFEAWVSRADRATAVVVGPGQVDLPVERTYHVPCRLTSGPLRLMEHLAIKLVLNTLSTATMVKLGRVVGNWMVHVTASNKKLIDRSTRLVSQLTGVDYDAACHAVFEAMQSIAADYSPDQERPSPAALAIERIGVKQPGQS